jgi:hypothetical protein
MKKICVTKSKTFNFRATAISLRGECLFGPNKIILRNFITILQSLPSDIIFSLKSCNFAFIGFINFLRTIQNKMLRLLSIENKTKLAGFILETYIECPKNKNDIKVHRTKYKYILKSGFFSTEEKISISSNAFFLFQRIFRKRQTKRIARTPRNFFFVLSSVFLLSLFELVLKM